MTTRLPSFVVVLSACAPAAPSFPAWPAAPAAAIPAATLPAVAGGDPAPPAPPAQAAQAAPPPPPELAAPVSAALASGLHNPMPGGLLAGYIGDTGLDIAGSPRPVFAIAAGRLDYSEPGHTRWTGPRDTPNSVRIQLDAPLDRAEHKVTHVYYSHLSELAFHQPEGAKDWRRVRAGEYLGMSGVARGSPHLHLGFLLDGEVEQEWGTYLSADEVRAMLGPYRNGQRLPDDPAAAALRAGRKPAGVAGGALARTRR